MAGGNRNSIDSPTKLFREVPAVQKMRHAGRPSDRSCVTSEFAYVRITLVFITPTGHLRDPERGVLGTLEDLLFGRYKLGCVSWGTAEDGHSSSSSKDGKGRQDEPAALIELAFMVLLVFM